MIDTIIEVAKIAVALFFGASIGYTFADIDLAPPLPVKHRSAWTHGLLVPIGLLWLTEPGTYMFWFTAAFLPAYALHLFYDMFPKKWHGGAFIKLHPLPGSLGGLLSFLWLLAGVVAAGYVFYIGYWPVIWSAIWGVLP